MRLCELLSKADVFCRFGGEEDPDVQGISTDSRSVRPNQLFVCIRGLKHDAHLSAGEAAANGAAAILAEGEVSGVPAGIPVVYTDDTRAAVARLWNVWYGFPARDIKLAAVTGTNGKTTVTQALFSIFSAAGYRCGTIGTLGVQTPSGQIQLSNGDVNANMTTPDPEQLYAALAKMRDDGAEYVFMEVTSHSLALRKVAPLFFETAVFTKLTSEHLDFHGSMENYFLAKASLLRKCKTAVVNRDDPWSARYLSYAAACGCECRMILTTENYAPDADYRAEHVVLHGSSGISYTLRSRSLARTIRSRAAGAFSVMNTLQAAACALENGISPKFVGDALAVFGGAKGRLEKIKTVCGYPASVYIDYAHTPDAMENVLRAARGILPVGSALWVVFGCGGDRDKTKRPVMARIASRYADKIILTRDNSRSEEVNDILSDVAAGLDGAVSHAVISDRRDAIEYAVMNASRGDVVILAGKGHEQYEIDKFGRHSFSEAEIVKNAARERMGTGEKALDDDRG